MMIRHYCVNGLLTKMMMNMVKAMMILKLPTICPMMMRHCADGRWTFDDDDDHALGKEMSKDDEG